MKNKETLDTWTKECLKRKKVPIALVTMSEDGVPHVFTQHSSETMAKVYKHLLDSGTIDEKTIIEGRDN